MKQEVDTNRVEGLADGMKRLNSGFEDALMAKCKDVSRLVNDTRGVYSESYVQSAASEVDHLVQEIQRLTHSISKELEEKGKTLERTAHNYKRQELELIKLIEMRNPWAQVPLNPFISKNKSENPFEQTVLSDLLTPVHFLPDVIEPLTRDLSLEPNHFSDKVMELQMRLEDLGYDIEINGYFDEQTLEVVNIYKDKYGLENEGGQAGVVGEQTWRYLFGTIVGQLIMDPDQYSELVGIAQVRLGELGFDIEATGYFDEATLRAVNSFRRMSQVDRSEEINKVIGSQTWKALFNLETSKYDKNRPSLSAGDPYRITLEDILNRDDPEAQKRLQNTYWAELSKEEQNRWYKELKEAEDKEDKWWADKARLSKSGMGNQFAANLFVGGSSILVNGINTATAGTAELLSEWILGPKPEGYVDPLDDPYGKRAGEMVGYGVGIFLPFKYLKAMKTPAILGKLSPTILRTVTAEAIFSTVTEISDSMTDFKRDGDQSLGERGQRVAINSVMAVGGDIAFTFATKAISKALQGSAGKKLQELLRRGKADDLAEGVREGTPSKPGKSPEIDGMDEVQTGGRVPKYTDTEIDSILSGIKDGIKANPLRQAYEAEVAGLVKKGEKLLSQGKSQEEVAKILYQARRDLGVKYKDATPQPLRDYIYEINLGRYGDPLGPAYESLLKKKTPEQIMQSSSRYNDNIDGLLSGFKEWLRSQ